MALSRQQQIRDRAEALQARREAAEMLKEASGLLKAAKKKLAYQKGQSVDLELNRMMSDMEDVIETLNDPSTVPK